jgi:photosystem II stability/assembly factor-like uncharacterized protein
MAGAAGPHWETETSGVTARLRGVSASSARVAWASGSGGTILRTADGGGTWNKLTIAGAEKLDFRDIDAINEKTAYVLSIGNGASSRIYKTTDAGAHWTAQFQNDDPNVFLDAMTFADANHGFVMGDSIAGAFVILSTADGGAHWTRVPAAALPAALPNEGAFAASGTNVAMLSPKQTWIGTGASTTSRVLRTADGGKTWKIAETPLATSASAGIFSTAFRDPLHGLVVGGDYRKEGDAVDNAAVTSDGGATWTIVKGLSGFRSVVAHVPRSKASWVVVGPQGADWSSDDGKTWTPIVGDGYDTLSFAPDGTSAWAAGNKGRIARLIW